MLNGLSQEEINELRELRDLLKRQQVQDDKDEPRSLPNEVRLKMEQTASSQLKNKLRQYARNISKYEGGSWTKSGTVNRVYLPELKKYNVDSVQHINTISKGAGRLRTAASFSLTARRCLMDSRLDQMRALTTWIKAMTSTVSSISAYRTRVP